MPPAFGRNKKARNRFSRPVTGGSPIMFENGLLTRKTANHVPGLRSSHGDLWMHLCEVVDVYASADSKREGGETRRTCAPRMIAPQGHPGGKHTSEPGSTGGS